MRKISIDFSIMTAIDRRLFQVSIAGWVIITGFLYFSFFREPPVELYSSEMLALAICLVPIFAAFAAVIVVTIPVRITVNLFASARRSSHRTETIFLCLVLFAIATSIAHEAWERKALAPPPGVTTLEAFARAIPPPRHLITATHEGKRIFSWHGELMSLLTIPSGPSCYLFDESGNLIDWQAETGDGGPVERILIKSEGHRPIALAEALASVEQK